MGIEFDDESQDGIERTAPRAAGRPQALRVVDHRTDDDFIDVDGSMQRIERHEVLEPGRYWRVKVEVKRSLPRYTSYHRTFHEGDAHLLLSVHEHEGKVHSVDVLEHPRDGGADVFTFLIDEFIEGWQPIDDAEADAIRAREQAELMTKISDVQKEMAEASVNPLALPGVREAAEEAVQAFEQQEVAKAQAESQSAEKRDQDIRRIHRRAGRRSAAKGNPVAIRRSTISDSVDVMISEGISSDGVRDLSIEAGRRIAIATAASKWLTDRTKVMSEYMKALTPYYAEKPQVALAKSRDAITLVKTLSQGIESLKLYTGDSVTVVPLATGKDASTDLPLALIQGKRFMDEELSTWSHVEDDFDYQSRQVFFDQLVSNRNLLDQVLPLGRCVVSMAVTAREVDYGRDTHWYDALMKKLANQQVFLLVRNGENIHVVYSEEPSHEAASRLFPTYDEMDAPFCGVDGTKIGLNDIRFAKAKERHDDLALVYKRFLILLCGLDHREQLFGDFYPRELGLKFMSREFQRQYFRFIEDENHSVMLEHGEVMPVQAWIADRNSFIRSGSRIVLATGATMGKVTKAVSGRKSMRLATEAMRGEFIATVSKGFHRVQVPCVDINEPRDKMMATAWLDGPDHQKEHGNWYLCVDKVRLSEVRSYLYSRRHRSSNISWLRTLRRVEEVLIQDLSDQAELRAYLRAAAVDNKVLSEDKVDGAIEDAIATWRADRRGIAAPSLAEMSQVNEILTLMFPSKTLAETIEGQALALAESLGEEPLRLVRTGKTRLALYTVAPEKDRVPYGRALHWGWVKRHSVAMKKSKLESTSSALVWIERKVQSAVEEAVIEWPAMDAWLQPCAEPARLKEVAAFLVDLKEAERWKDVLLSGTPAPGQSGIDDDTFAAIVREYREKVASSTYYSDCYFAIPVAMYQRTLDSKPVFVYAQCRGPRFVYSFGSEEQKERFRTFAHRSQASREDLAQPAQWSLVGAKRRISSTLNQHEPALEIVQIPWRNVESHPRGGLTRKELNRQFGFGHRTTRRQRREEGGKPQVEREQHFPVCMNRAFENLAGVNPALRRAFYKALPERLRDAERPFGDGSPEKIKAVREQRYEPKRPGALVLSPLVWNHEQGRSVANKVFRSPRKK